MDAPRFDDVARSLFLGSTRRGILGAFAAMLGLAAPRPAATAARKGKKKRKKTPQFNEFGCLNVGKRCRKTKHCCSGICAGPKGKERCKPHDSRGCQAGQTHPVCLGPAIEPCLTSGGGDGFCLTTTGNAGYCGVDGDCRSCAKDADCRPFCGPRAACIPCGLCLFAGTFTACFGPSADSCTFPA